MPNFRKQAETWWLERVTLPDGTTRPMTRAEFMARQAAEQHRMSVECDPYLPINHTRDTVSRVSKPPQHADFLTHYGDDVTQEDAA